MGCSTPAVRSVSVVARSDTVDHVVARCGDDRAHDRPDVDVDRGLGVGLRVGAKHVVPANGDVSIVFDLELRPIARSEVYTWGLGRHQHYDGAVRAQASDAVVQRLLAQCPEWVGSGQHDRIIRREEVGDRGSIPPEHDLGVRLASSSRSCVATTLSRQSYTVVHEMPFGSTGSSPVTGQPPAVASTKRQSRLSVASSSAGMICLGTESPVIMITSVVSVTGGTVVAWRDAHATKPRASGIASRTLRGRASHRWSSPPDPRAPPRRIGRSTRW